MIRSELEDAICNELNIEEERFSRRTRSRGLGEDALVLLYKHFNPEAPNHRSRFGNKSRKRKRIADLLGLELDSAQVTNRRVERNFHKGELEQIYNLFQDRPEQNTWESVLSWPPQAIA